MALFNPMEPPFQCIQWHFSVGLIESNGAVGPLDAMEPLHINPMDQAKQLIHFI